MGLGRAAAPSGPAWPGGEQRLGWAGRPRKREATWGGPGQPTPALGPATRHGGAAPEVVSPSTLGLNSRAAEGTLFFFFFF